MMLAKFPPYITQVTAVLVLRWKMARQYLASVID
jgi:hypothetical protein